MKSLNIPKGKTRVRKLKERQYNGEKEKDKQWGIKHYTEN